jgi:hypothetical protein
MAQLVPRPQALDQGEDGPFTRRRRRRTSSFCAIGWLRCSSPAALFRSPSLRAKLGWRDRHHPISRRRPEETAALQPLGIERHAEPIVPKDLDQLAAFATEHVEVGIVLSRLDGPTLMQLSRSGAMTPAQTGAILASLYMADAATHVAPAGGRLIAGI